MCSATSLAAALAKAWPRLSAARGKFVFLYLVPGLNLAAFAPYMQDRPSLQGRVAFVQGLPGMAHTAFVLVDNALTRPDRIPALVKAGYLVRSRADIDTDEARRGDGIRRDRTLASGAPRRRPIPPSAALRSAGRLTSTPSTSTAAPGAWARA